MSSQLIIVERRSDFRWAEPDARVLTAQEYITDAHRPAHRSQRIVNLCRSYSYLSIGYYVSLLAEARGDRITPSVETITDLQQKSIQAMKLTSLNRCLSALPSFPRAINSVRFQVIFGQAEDLEWADIAASSFELFRCPLLAVDLKRINGGEGWRVDSLHPIDLRDLDTSRDRLFQEGLSKFSRRPWKASPTASAPRMDLAVLHDPKDPMPPSKLKTLQHLAGIGEEMGIAVELIEKKDFSRLAQFDALFIRETTAIAHHTFRFARKAVGQGMPVIDDPESILRCTNKAYLSEILASHAIPTPRTMFLTRRTLPSFENALAYPVVLKVPDGAFSLAVKKAENWAKFQEIASIMLKESDLILVQEFVYTDFDWRIGVLAGKVIFAAKYFMSDGHWQIIQHGAPGKYVEGKTQAIDVRNVPPEVLNAAVAASQLIGNGLYGVDIKQTKTGPLVIEVNDNPNIDLGMEDAATGDHLYRVLLKHFQALVDARQQVKGPVIEARVANSGQ